jgi:hypothetical protein
LLKQANHLKAGIEEKVIGDNFGFFKLSRIISNNINFSFTF